MPIIRLLIAGLIVAALAAPQEPQEAFRTGVNVVVAPTVVTDKDGNYVNGLQPHQFRLIDNEKLQDIKVDVSWVPISLVVAIQANAATEPVLGKIKKIGPLFQGLVVGEQGQVAIMAFDHRRTGAPGLHLRRRQAPSGAGEAEAGQHDQRDGGCCDRHRRACCESSRRTAGGYCC